MSIEIGTERFRVEEATIADLHRAIREGRTTCVDVVHQYLERVRAYNGVASVLVTRDGADVPEAAGTTRGGAPLRFPTRTLAASELLPDLDRYQGPPLELGRMEATASDPEVAQQFGMVAGVPHGGQLNALATLNIRGERSVVCPGELDRHPSEGPLPPGAPAVCEVLRRQPDALEQAAELDATYGRDPDLERMPVYGVVFSFKDAFDTRDMRSTCGADARYDVDFPARDHTLVERLRRRGAIIFAKAVCTEYNGRVPYPDGPHEPSAVLPSTLGYQRSTWAGNPANPYDTTRAASFGSSSGSGSSVGANLVMASIGEETRASCRGPANHNAVALILPHKAMLGFHGGGIGADPHVDRAGIICRTIADCATVLDALRDPDDGYYDPRDPYTTVPRPSILATSYAEHARMPGERGSLAGLRIGIVRESMLPLPDTKATEPISLAAAREIKAVLGDALGATLVESAHPLWTPDPGVEQMTVDFRRALARLVPLLMPDLLFRLTPDGEPLFPEFAAAIVPTEFAPGRTFGGGRLAPIDYMVELAEGRIEPPAGLDVATVQQLDRSPQFRYHLQQYLTRRAADWDELGIAETLRDWPALNARSKFWGDDQRASFANWAEVDDPRAPLGGRQPLDERIMLRELLRRVDMMVMLENRLDALVRLHMQLPPGRIGGAPEPGMVNRLRAEAEYGPNAGVTEVLVPAGWVTTAYDASFALSPDRTRYVSVPASSPTALEPPGLPFSLVFRAEPGREDVVLRIASAYEAATRHRVPPPSFGPVAP
ncbi:MAG TPA: amidase family protein [Solirubrobacteraceae bacterium]|nr:amidase family protein [Solirubrobacteraceae bacterium]